jgi:hypothetical protein
VSAADTGSLESLDGWWQVTWDHTGAIGYLTYQLEDRDSGALYVARYDDGWRVAPAHMATVDMERLLPTDSDFDVVRELLDRAAGRGTPGVLVVPRD